MSVASAPVLKRWSPWNIYVRMKKNNKSNECTKGLVTTLVISLHIFCRKTFWMALSCTLVVDFGANHVQLSRWALQIVSTRGNAKLHTETSPNGPIWGEGWFYIIFTNEAVRTLICKCIIRRLSHSMTEARTHSTRYPKQTAK